MVVLLIGSGFLFDDDACDEEALVCSKVGCGPVSGIEGVEERGFTAFADLDLELFLLSFFFLPSVLFFSSTILSTTIVSTTILP